MALAANENRRIYTRALSDPEKALGSIEVHRPKM